VAEDQQRRQTTSQNRSYKKDCAPRVPHIMIERTFGIKDNEDLRDCRVDCRMSKALADLGVELAHNVALRTIVANFRASV
jgi:hypothetical protein